MEEKKQAYRKAMEKKDHDKVTMRDIKNASKMSGGMMGGGKKNYKMSGVMGAKTGKLIGKQKNLPKHLQEKILA